MAKGMKCPSCKFPMFALTEKVEPAGTEVVYQCNDQTCKNKVKVFEDN